MAQKVSLETVVSAVDHGRRLDQTLSAEFSDYSRNRIKGWIESGLVTIDGKTVTVPKTEVLEGQHLVIEAEIEDDTRFEPQDIPLNIVYQDDDILVIDKPAGLVVHPGAGCKDQTVLNAVLFHFPETQNVPRAGIVHRLDKDTSGLMVIARNVEAQNRLVKAISRHEVVREYEAFVCGHMTAGGIVDKPIGRHPRIRTCMAVVPEGYGKEAVTHYRVLEKFRAHTRLRLRLETGRTHQIRVHMSYINHGLVGDQQYGETGRRVRGASPEFSRYLATFPRQALHAVKLGLVHPVTGESLEFESPIPEDMRELLEQLRVDNELHPDEIVWS
ncbi:MAG: 23S rRNA pseudouridine(1911/1915/1917) synthase RluD [Succinivibrionaceae bacterium]|nr:23S rRNA pseudouridine(1911/1915/1917) synthase RluD [Succinivibrionaceae bacterium]